MEETRVTSSDFDKINVTDMHQVTMQEAAEKASYEDIPVEEVSSAATFKKPFERRESLAGGSGAPDTSGGIYPDP